MAVPTHTFKVVLVRTGDRLAMFAAIVPNTAETPALLDQLATSVDDVERRSGLDFFSALDDAVEAPLEAAVTPLPPGARGDP